MAYLSAVIGVRDSSGVRVDAPDSLGNYLPIVLKLGANLTATATQSGGVSVVTIAAAGGGSVTSVTGSAPIVSSGGATPEISISAASGAAAGSMSPAHFSLVDGATDAPTPDTLVLRDAAGRFQAVAGVAADDVAVVSQLGGTSWRVAPDSHDLGIWTMSESSGAFANTGSAGALDLTPSGLVSLDYARQGPLVTCASFRGTAYAIGPNATGLCEPASALTVWAWMLLTGHAAGLGPLIAAKLHDTPPTWSAPYEDWAIWGADSGTDRAWYVGVNIGGSLVYLTLGVDGYGVADRAALTLGVPHLVGLTHDGTTLRAYLDGALVGSTAASGSIGWGDGPIVRGGNPSYSGHGGNLYLGEMRIADTVRSAAYFREVYQSFMRRWP